MPWLLLRAVAHAGNGIFSRFDYVQRIHTQGGAPLTGGCDAAHARVTASFEYQAHYFFYTPVVKPSLN